MRKSAIEKARSRERIVGAAARLIREQGMASPSVAEVMQAAGMTHGGFYKHFGDRSDMVLAALESAFEENLARLDDLLAHAEEPRTAFLDWYLSTAHASQPGKMCAVAGLGNDVARCDDVRIQGAFAMQTERYLERLEPIVGTRDGAVVLLSTAVGALSLARAEDSAQARDALLATVRDTVNGR